MKREMIHIENASENNLAHICVDIPKYAFTVITGLSGSGKSTLAFDTLYMEARRRFLDTLSVYARQFVGAIKRPKVEKITGLTPAIAVVQATASSSETSTVGTITELYDFLRLLWGRAGEQCCPKCGIAVSTTSRNEIFLRIKSWPAGSKFILYSPLVTQRKGQHDTLIKKLHATGFNYARIDGRVVELASLETLAKTVRHTIELQIDRLIVKETAYKRIEESLSTALMLGNGQCIVERLFADAPPQSMIFSENATCPRCGKAFCELSPDRLSFNRGAGCTQCHGRGYATCIQDKMLIGDPNLVAISPEASLPSAIAMLNTSLSIRKTILQHLRPIFARHGLRTDQPWNRFSHAQQSILIDALHEGLYEALKCDELTDEENAFLATFFDRIDCPKCHATRLNEDARNVHFVGKSLGDVLLMTIDQASDFFEHLDASELSDIGARIVEDLLPTLRERLQFLKRVGLGYLQLARGADTLSGGELQRIRLTTLLGNGLTAVTYVLDEPSIGLHARDQARLIGVLGELRDRGNTVVVVEHDEATMRACDYLIDIGPKAGRFGGQVVYAGPIQAIDSATQSLTIDYLMGRKCVPVPQTRRVPKHWFKITQAARYNIRGIDLDIPQGCIVCVTGVSGSGKSTLINDIFLPNARHLYSHQVARFCDSFESTQTIDRVIEVDQKPIGRTPRSNPATYTKVFDHIRSLFAATPEARMYGYSPSRFSFNVSSQKGGRCEACLGAGVRTIEMKFLSNTYVTCEECHGKRFNDATLRVRYNGRNIADVLDMSFEEALSVFEGQIKIEKILRAVVDVGLGYIKLGQPSPTLSGGEAQRMKLATELAKTSKKHTVFVFDEPTTGLHNDDVAQLINVLNRLADLGHSVIIIEHNLDIIKASDYVIDMGPEPGDLGGQIVAIGTPEQIATCATSHTGQYLKRVL